MTKANIIIANDKGGVGKSLVTTGIMLAAALDGLTLRGVEAENEPRLAKRYPGAFEHVRIDDAVALLEQDSNRAVAQFDPIFNRLAEGGVVLDLGANVAGKMLSILAGSGADAFVGEGETTAIVIVSTAEAEAVRAALSNATAAIELMPKARRFLVVNGYRGDISDDAPFVSTMRDTGFEIVRIGQCRAATWGIVRERPFTELTDISRDTIVGLGVEPAPAARDAAAIKKFVGELARAAQPIVAWAKGIA